MSVMINIEAWKRGGKMLKSELKGQNSLLITNGDKIQWETLPFKLWINGKLVSSSKEDMSDKIIDMYRWDLTKRGYKIINDDSVFQKDEKQLNENFNVHPVYKLKVFHGTNNKFDEFDLDKSTYGSIWFTDNLDSIKNGTHGGEGSKYILTRFITINNPAGWDEYEKYSIDELINNGYDGVILPEDDKIDYIVFDLNSISTTQ